MYKKKNQKETKQKFKLLEAARRRAQESPRYVAPGTDCSPGSDVVNVVQVQRRIVILKYALMRLERCDLCVTQRAEHSMCSTRV